MAAAAWGLRRPATAGRQLLVGNCWSAAWPDSCTRPATSTEWAVTGLAENTRRMVTGSGVGVTPIAPGRVETPFWDGLGQLPEGNLLTADQVGEAICWAIGQPAGVDVNTLVIRPVGQPV